MPESLEQQLNRLTPTQPEQGYKGPTQEQAKKVLFGEQAAEEVEQDIESAVEQMGETEAAKSKRERTEFITRERQAESITHVVGEALFKKLLELSAQPEFAAKDMATKYSTALEQIYPTVFAEAKPLAPGVADNLITDQIMKSYARVLEENRVAQSGAMSAAEADMARRIYKSKAAGMIQEEVSEEPTAPELSGVFEKPAASATSFANVPDRAAPTTEKGTPSSAGFRLEDLERPNKKSA